jgi:Zn-dependent protease
MEAISIIQFVILIFSIIIHETAHGYAALWQGDPTAKYAGRLTLNPIKHADPIGSVFLPLVMVLLHSPVILGWAKPVPFNPYNLKNQRWGELLVAIAGPVSNIALAVLGALSIRLFGSGFNSEFTTVLLVTVFINLALAVFNLIPIPPLDGSKVLFGIFPDLALKVRGFFERFGFLIIIFLLFSGALDYLGTFIIWLTNILVGF